MVNDDVVQFVTVAAVVMLLVFSVAGRAHAAEDYTVFPVSDYGRLSLGNTGNNHYYDMAKNPRTGRVLTVGGGYQDMLLYEDARFRVQVLPRKVYSYGVSWHPEQDYALVAGSRLPPKSAGLILKYTGIDTGAKLLKLVKENLTGIDFNSNGTALIVGGTVSPRPSNVILKYDGNQFERISDAGTTPLKTVAWRPDSDEALIIGLEGTVLRYDGGTVESLSNKASGALFSVAWSPDGSRALIGGEQGKLYRWKNGYLLEIATDFDWGIRDIAWHPSGEKALVVGGTRGGEQGYWGMYRSLELSSNTLSKPFFSVEWIDENNALIGGQKTLWRLSSNTDTQSLGLRPSISLKDRSVKSGDEILASGFGSTAYGGVHRVSAYQFRLDGGPAGSWQNRVAARARPRAPGQHTISMRIRDDRGRTSNWVAASFRITGDRYVAGYLFNWSLYELITMIVLLVLSVLLIGWLFREDLRDLLG